MKRGASILAGALGSWFLLSSLAGAADRSRSTRAEFQRTNPCPSTGKPRGPCPGWQVDHHQPICADGRDAIDNLRWIEVEPHKEKTRKDVAACRGRAYRSKPIG